MPSRATTAAFALHVRSTIPCDVSRPPGDQRLAPAASGLLAVLLTVAVMVPSLRSAGWSLTALPRVDSKTGMAIAARRIDPGFRLVHPGSYDGQFYWGIAVDPVAVGDVHQAFDTASYRYGHPLYGWFGWLFSAGQARAAPAALAAVALLAMFIAAAAAAALGPARGLFVALNPGLLYAGAHDLGEPLAAALMLGVLLAYFRRRRIAALVCLALLPLAKEDLVLIPLALAAWELWRRRNPRDATLLAATILPSVAWWIYVRVRLGAWFTSGGDAIGVPFAGWKRALLDAGTDSYAHDAARSMLGESTIVVYTALLVLLAIAMLVSLRLRTPIQLLFIPLAAIVACLAPKATVLLRDGLRNTALLVALAPLVLYWQSETEPPTRSAAEEFR
jgi:hypothetical protein